MRRAGGNSGTTLDLTNGRIYIGDGALTGTEPASGAAYELHYLHPNEMFNLFTNTLDQLLVATLVPIPRFADADQETSGVGSWTASSATLTKVTTAANVYVGTQSQRVLLTGAGYSQSATMNVIPGKTYWVSAKVRVDTAGPFELQVIDITNSAEIDASGAPSTSLERFVHLERQFTTPSTCEQIALRLAGTANLDDSYWGPINGPWGQGDRAPINMPSWLTQEEHLLKVMPARYVEQYATNVYDAYSRVFDKPYQKGRDYQLRINPHHANPYTLEWRTTPRWGYELWIEALRPASDVYTAANTAAGETSPSINLDARMVALMTARAACVRVLNDEPNHAQAKQTLEYIDGPKGKIGPLAQLLAVYEKNLVTKQQEPVVLHTHRSIM